MGTPTTDEYVKAFLLAMRAPTKKRTTFGQVGRFEIGLSGERVLRAPDGTPIRIVETPDGSTQIEHGDSLHAVVRPTIINVRGGVP